MEEAMEETVSLDEIFQLLKKNIVMIIGCIVAGVVISSAITFLIITPKYSATTQLVAQNKGADANVNTDNINSNLLLINTYKDIVTNKAVIEQANDQLAKDGMTGITTDKLSKIISVEQNQNSQLFSINAVTTNPVEAAAIANTVAAVFQKEAVKLTDTDKVSVASKATPNYTPVSPNKKVNIAIGAALGLIVGIMIALLSELFNRTVKSEEYVSEVLGVPILGSIPLISDREMNEIRKLQRNALINEDIFLEVSQKYDDLADSEVDGLASDIKKYKKTSYDYTID